MTVLIIDENKDNALAYARRLSILYDVCICTNRSSASNLLIKLQPDVLVIDLRILLTSDPLPYKPKVIIGTTYFVSERVIHQAETADVDEILMLPCSLDYLTRRVQELLDFTIV